MPITRHLLKISAAPVLGLASYLAAVQLTESDDQIERLRHALSAEALRFERAMGYGGFIHHFKNAVLRPDEPLYGSIASNRLAEARRALARIRVIGADLGIRQDLRNAEAALDAYEAALAAVRDPETGQTTARELDRAIRVDDTLALNDIDDFIAGISLEIREDEAWLQDVRTLAVSLMFAAVVVSLIVIRGSARPVPVSRDRASG